MSIIITINDNKIYPSDIVVNKCNICLENKKKIQKCSECEFFICNSCLIKWYQYNSLCPHCKNISTYVKPLSNKEKCKLFCNKKKIKIKKYHNKLKENIGIFSNNLIKKVCNSQVIECLSNTFLFCGVSLLYLLYGSLYVFFYLLIMGLAVLVIVGLVYCTCCCCHSLNSYDKY